MLANKVNVLDWIMVIFVVVFTGVATGYIMKMFTQLAHGIFQLF